MRNFRPKQARYSAALAIGGALFALVAAVAGTISGALAVPTFREFLSDFLIRYALPSLAQAFVLLAFCYENIALANWRPRKSWNRTSLGTRAMLARLLAWIEALLAALVTGYQAHALLGYPLWQALLAPGAIVGLAMWHWTVLVLSAHFGQAEESRA